MTAAYFIYNNNSFHAKTYLEQKATVYFENELSDIFVAEKGKIKAKI